VWIAYFAKGQKDGILLSMRSKDPDNTIRLSHCYIECNEVG